MVESIRPEVEAFFDGHPLGIAAFRAVSEVIDDMGPYEVRAGKTQVGFRRRRGFAYLWLPGRWLPKPDADVVLSVATCTPLRSERFKEVVHPSSRVWMHHLELREATQIDAEVAGWLRQAYADSA